MIGWIILFSVLLILIIVLSSSVKITLYVSDKAVFKVDYLFFNFLKYDSTVKEEKAKKRKKTKKKDKSFTGVLKEYAASKKKTELFFEIIEYIKIVLKKLKKLLKHTRFTNAVLDIIVATSDAADTAILYGKVCSAVYPLIEILDSALKFYPNSISVKTDFSSEKMKFLLSGVFKIRVIHILGFVLSTAFSIIKTKIGDINYVKQS